jgi:peptidyl-Asp metalloendopeptidase
MHGREMVHGRRAVVLVLAASLVWSTLVTAGPSAAASLPSLFDTPAVAGGPATSARHGVQRRATVRQRQATAQRGLLTRPDGSSAVGVGDRLRLNLFDDASFSLTVADVAPYAGRGHTWSGTLDGVDLGYAVLAAHDGALVGHVIMPGAVYRIGYAPDGTQVVEEIDQAALPLEGHAVEPPAPAVGEDLPADGEVPGVAADAAVLIDVMVLYTAAARAAAGGTAAMQAEVNLAVAATNQAYQNNNLAQRLRLVFAGEASITEGDFNAELDWLQVNPTVDWLRNVSRADVVSLITDHGPSPALCGVGFRMRTNSTGFAPFGFSVVERVCASSNLTFAHELGHNMGAHHDAYVTGVPDNALFPYSHGYVDLVGKFRTIMAYPTLCSDAGLGCNKIPFFSTPGTTQSGRPIGTASTADNARTLSQTAATVANFRQAATAPLTITTGVNKATITVGETLVASVGVSNPGIAATADIYLGLLRPDGTTTFFTDVVATGTSGFVIGNILNFATYRPIAAGVPLGAPGAANFPTFLSLQRTSSDQAGGFVWFLLAVTSGALHDGILAPNELLGASFSPFSYPK